ncbi:MAG: ArsA family ATPase [Deltaproteobacteria bacterium]|nr:ArsA family ATPase [Deltaproteobacteria bacterium]MBI3389054.1 ArsA family ATPase [Deltaproteobacteria bacterium]
MKALASVLAKHRVVICAGSGGVGKTSTAAAIALYGAQHGARAIVLTIDPARRLADALGLGAMGSEERAVPINGGGSLTAMMLDQKGAWDTLVERHAPSEEARQRILANRFYQHLSQSFAGSQEYMAVEQLCELHESGRYDLIVVDTPPTQHALDFLEAPQRIADFLDKSVVRWFVKPYFSAGWATLRFMNRTVGVLFRKIEEATGVAALAEVSDFFTSMGGLFDGFEARVRRVYELLRARETAFVLVVSPEEQVLREAEYFCRMVGERRMALRAVVFNRVHREYAGRPRTLDPDRLRALVTRTGGAAATEALVQNFLRFETVARGDMVRMESFRRQLPKSMAIAEVPNFDADLHDIASLMRMHPYLFADAA